MTFRSEPSRGFSLLKLAMENFFRFTYSYCPKNAKVGTTLSIGTTRAPPPHHPEILILGHIQDGDILEIRSLENRRWGPRASFPLSGGSKFGKSFLTL